MIPLVNLKRQYQAHKLEIDTAIFSVLEASNFIKGKPVSDFEKNFAEINNSKHCLAVANGTDSLFIIMKALNIGIGDEVITVTNTWISSSETISLTGAKPVFVDSDEYFTIDVSKIKKSITKNTKAIIAVHLYGQVCELNSLKEICDNNNIYLIEDCAQAHFAEYKNEFVGNFGIAGSFSFFPGKNLGAYGDSGGIVTNNSDLYLKMKMFANHGAIERHNHIIEGMNSRLDTIQAAILNVKLNHILDWTKKRRENASLYTELLGKIPQVELPKIRANSKHSFHLYVIKVRERNELIEHLDKHNIASSIHYPTILPDQKCYESLINQNPDFEKSREDSAKILSLPMCSDLNSEEITFIANTIKQFYES
jgi:dTDP-4-amino-4,6-dideoxygalactose transaminase